MNPEKPITVVEVAAFLKRHQPMVRYWDRPNLLSCIDWYVRHSLLGLVREGGEIVGVAWARIGFRAVIEKTGLPAWYVHNERGDTAIIDLACVTKPWALRPLWGALLCRAHNCRYIAFKRGERSLRVRIYNIERMTQLIGERAA